MAGGSWSRTGLLVTARTDPAVARPADGRVLVAGGSYFDESSTSARALSSAELYDPATGTRSVTGSLDQARSGARAVTLDDGRVLVVGGTTDATAYPFSGSPLANAELYDPASGGWSPAGSLSEARDGFVLVALAEGGASSPVA